MGRGSMIIHCGKKRWEQLLSTADGVDVQTSFDWPKAEQFAAADVIVFYSNNPGFTRGERAGELDAFLKRGGRGWLYLHFAVDGHLAPDELAGADWIGVARGGIEVSAWAAGFEFSGSGASDHARI